MLFSADTSLPKPISPKPDRYIPALTGLRAIAAYLVFLHHYNPALSTTFAYRLVAQGYIGVSIFFVLSGFLIYHRYADVYFAHENWSWRGYLQNRFARIFPLYIVILFITVGINATLKHSISLSGLLLNLTLLKGFFDEYKFSGIAQSWSLTVELCFYLSAPLLFAGLRRCGPAWLTASLVSVGLLLLITVGQTAWHGFFSNLPFVLFYTFFGRAFEFVAGMWLARCWHQNYLPIYRFSTFFGLLIVSICVLWQASILHLMTTPAVVLWSEVLVYNYILPVGICIFFLGLLCEDSFIRYVVSLPVLQALGRSSYAFYLIHIGHIASGFRQLGLTNTWLFFGLLILVAHSLYLFIEKPLHRCLSPYNK